MFTQSPAIYMHIFREQRRYYNTVSLLGDVQSATRLMIRPWWDFSRICVEVEGLV